MDMDSGFQTKTKDVNVIHPQTEAEAEAVIDGPQPETEDVNVIQPQAEAAINGFQPETEDANLIHPQAEAAIDGFQPETEDVNVIHPQPEAAIDGITSQTEAPEVAKTCPDKECLLPGSSNSALILSKEEPAKTEEHHKAKRLKTSGEGGTSLSSVNGTIKQAAEVLLILSNMGQMRAGRSPTEVERELMAKARHQLGYLAGKLLLPKDMVSKEGVQNMIQDLGLNKLKEDHPMTPGPRKSIAERASDTMKKIEQARLSTISTAIVSNSLSKADHAPVNVPINGTSVALTAQVSQPGPRKQSVSIAQPIPIAQPFKPAIPVISRTPVAQPVPIETRAPVVTTAAVVGHPIIAPTSAIIPQAQVSLMPPVAALAPILRVEDQTETRLTVAGLPATTMIPSVLEAHSLPAQMRGQVLKPSVVPGMISEKKSALMSAETAVEVVRDHSKGSMLSSSNVPAIVQTSSISLENVGKDVDLPVQAPRKLEANHDLKEFHSTAQFEQKDFKGVSMPTASLSHQTMHVTPQGPKLTDSLAIRANHTDIARNVQKILQSRPPDFRQWEPPSRAYMNAPITCQVCKINVPDVDTILVCDSCEKGVHLKCLQAYNQRGIPKGDWHCPKCLIASNGRPLPPKYGRVGKSSVVRRTPAIANKNSPQAFPGKKMENPHPKSSQHTTVSNGLNATPEIPIHVDLTHTNSRHLLQATGDTSGNLKPKSEMLLAQSIKKEEESNEPIKQELSRETADGFTGPLGTLSGKEYQPSPKNAVSPVPNQQLTHGAASVFGSHVGSKDSQHKQHSNINLHVVNQPQALSNSQGADRLRMEQAATAVGNVLQSTAIQRLPAELEGIPFSQFSVEGQTSKDIGDLCQEGEDVQQRKLHKTTIFDTKSSDEVTEQSRVTEEDDAYHVEWIGDKLEVSGGRTYYQSCCVKGVVYNLHDYALFRPETPNVPPYIAKLQVLWEDDDTGSKWVRVNWCYYPTDIPQVVDRPTTPEKDEVYESNRGDNNLVGSIQGPCQVLSSEKYKEEVEKRGELLKGGHEIGSFHPVFLCKWFFDATKGVFQPFIH